jgi:hypothetical protein
MRFGHMPSARLTHVYTDLLRVLATALEAAAGVDSLLAQYN